jgi:hypothetical protein
VLFDLAITWLVDHKVVLPGIITLERLVSRIRYLSYVRFEKTKSGNEISYSEQILIWKT